MVAVHMALEPDVRLARNVELNVRENAYFGHESSTPIMQ